MCRLPTYIKFIKIVWHSYFKYTRNIEYCIQITNKAYEIIVSLN